MKKRLLGMFLAGCMLFTLTACGEDIVEGAVNDILKLEGDPFVTGQTYQDDTAAITVDTAFLSDCTMAPLTLNEDGAFNGYFLKNEENPDSNDDYLYLDCISTVKNLSKEPLDIEEDISFYCVEDDDLYDHYMLFVESEDGTDLLDPKPLNSGETVRIHYSIVLPKDISWTGIKVYFVLPDGNSYTESLNKLIPTCPTFEKNTSLTSKTDATLTLKSVTVGDKITALTEAGGGCVITANANDDSIIDIAIEVKNNGKQPVTLGTLYGGLLISDSFGFLGSVLLEKDNDMVYSGEIAPGSTAMTHLSYELAKDPSDTEHFYLYLDGSYYSIDIK